MQVSKNGILFENVRFPPLCIPKQALSPVTSHLSKVPARKEITPCFRQHWCFSVPAAVCRKYCFCENIWLVFFLRRLAVFSTWHQQSQWNIVDISSLKLDSELDVLCQNLRSSAIFACTFAFDGCIFYIFCCANFFTTVQYVLSVTKQNINVH